MKNLLPTFLLMAMGLAGAQQTVMDMRPDMRWDGGPSQATQDRVLREVRTFYNLPKCEGGDVRDHITGSFTRLGAQQDAYLVFNCGALAADPGRSFGRLVIYENSRIIKSYQNIGDAIGNVGDLNLDGVDDLLFSTYFGPHMGEFLAGASVVSVKNAGFHTFLDIDMGEAYSDNCAVGIPAKSSQYTDATLLTVRKASRPLFTLQKYRRMCGRSSYELLETKTVASKPL